MEWHDRKCRSHGNRFFFEYLPDEERCKPEMLEAIGVRALRVRIRADQFRSFNQHELIPAARQQIATLRLEVLPLFVEDHRLYHTLTLSAEAPINTTPSFKS